MKLLKDDELASAIFHPAPDTSPLIDPVPSAEVFTTAESAIQPASIDLHVGQIFVPGEFDSSGAPNAKKQLSLKTGQTAVLTTKERLQLPRNIAAFGFPPARVSAAGLLMTNPGHIDPGFNGPLELTVINMGKEEFLLYEGLIIITVLSVQLSGDVTSDWQQRYGPQQIGTSVHKDLLSRLSADFLDIENRAQSIATKVVRDAELTIKDADIQVKRLQSEIGLAQTRLQTRYSVITALIAGIVTLLGLLITNFVTSSRQIDGLKSEIADLQKKTSDRSRLEQEIEQLRQQFNDLKLRDAVDERSTKK